MNERGFTHVIAVLVIFAFLAGCATQGGGDPSTAPKVAELRAEIGKMRADTLARLYKNHPPSRAQVQNAYGYAVFSNLGVNLMLLSMAGGSGVAHDNTTGRDVYMKMASGGVGLGIGIKDFRGVFVFKSAAAFGKFINDGWEAGAHADAVAKTDKRGGVAEGAVTVAPDVLLYQLTERGLAIEATIQGTRYFKDDALNGSSR